jgi:hypothetical protein
MKNTTGEPQTERIEAAIETVKSRLSKDDFPDNKQLARICKDYGIRLIDSDDDPHLIHEILETALNLHLSEADWLNPTGAKNKHEILARLENLTRKLRRKAGAGVSKKRCNNFPRRPRSHISCFRCFDRKPASSRLSHQPERGSLAIWLRRADA